MQAPNRLYKSEVRASVLCVKTPCEQGLPRCTYVLQAEQRLPSVTDKAKRSFPMELGPTAKHHPAWNPQCTEWFRAEERKLLCPQPLLAMRIPRRVVLRSGSTFYGETALRLLRRMREALLCL